MAIPRFLILIITFSASFSVSAQNGSGVIHGIIYGPQGETVPYLPVQATEAVSGEFERAESMTDGRYEISNLAAGSYTINIKTPCCAYQSYESEPIMLAAGESKEIEIHVLEGDSFNTIGDDPGVISAAMRSEADIPDEPPPRTGQNKPDLSGVWLIGADPFPVAKEVFAWVDEIRQQWADNLGVDNPHFRCLPGGPPIPGGAAPFITKFVQKDDLLIILFEDYPGFRQVFLDGRKHPEDPNPSWFGHSIGHWEGDTLVIDTVGFNDRGRMSGYPRSENLHLIERYTRPEYGQINLELTVEDPDVFTKPWSSMRPFHLTPQAELIEYVCENNKWAGAASGN